VFLFASALRADLSSESPSKVCEIWTRFKKNISTNAVIDTWSVQEKDVVQALFRNSLFFGTPARQEACFARAASLLELPISSEDVSSVEQYIKEQKPIFLESSSENPLDVLISTELKRGTPFGSSLLLPLLAQKMVGQTPKILHDVHRARAFAEAWRCIEEEMAVTRSLQSIFEIIEQTDMWSFGDVQKHFVVIGIHKEVSNSDFSWGNRRVWIFPSLLLALEHAWQKKSSNTLITHVHCRYPDASQCGEVVLREGIHLDEQKILGYRSTGRVFLEGEFWSTSGVVEKDTSQEEEKKQQEAKEELARLFLDSEDDISLD
jgi:hypothetical protein